VLTEGINDTSTEGRQTGEGEIDVAPGQGCRVVCDLLPLASSAALALIRLCPPDAAHDSYGDASTT